MNRAITITMNVLAVGGDPVVLSAFVDTLGITLESNNTSHNYNDEA